MTYFVAKANFPTAVIFGTKFLCTDLSISPLKSIISPGISVNTESRLRNIALIRTIARSAPILNCIKARAISPDIVVRLLEEISGIALLSALIQASLAGRISCSSL